MRMILGLDEPTSGSVTVNGRAPRAHAAPLHEVGGMLDPRAVHPSRSAYHHLLALAQTTGIRRSRVDEVINAVGLRSVAGRPAGKFSLGMAQRLGIAAALLGDPATVVLDEPVNGLDVEGIRWMRGMLTELAAQGKTVFVSSHLMSEIAQTATRLIVIGKGRLIADTSVAEFIASAAPASVRVRSSDQRGLATLLRSPDVTVSFADDGALLVSGLLAERIGAIAAAAGIAVAELSTVETSLEDAFVDLTKDAVEYRAVYFRGGKMSTLQVTQARVMKSEWTKLRTQPGALWSLLSAVILVVAFGILYSLLRVARPPHGAAAAASFDPTSVSLAGVQLAQVAAGVLGVLLITSEYATGLIRTTLAAVPRRLPTLWGKAAVVTGAVVAVSVPAAVAVFLAGQAILGRQHLSVSLGAPGVARAVIGGALYLAVAALLGLALGALLRSTAGGIAALFGLLFAVPILVGFLPGSLSDEIGKYLPGTAGLAVTSVHPDPATSLAPWTGFGVFCAYALVLLGVAAVRMRRGDA